MQILLAEDNSRLADITRRSLIEDGYMVDIAVNGQDAIDKFDINEYDAVILDIMMPEIDGVTVCRMMRTQDPNIPIIMLTALDEIDDKIKGLDSGADDYLVKPFSNGELSARIRALLRRGKKADPVILVVGKMALDSSKKTVAYAGQTLELTAKELVLLRYLMTHHGRVVPKTELLEHVWDMNYDGMSNVVETYIRYLRKKIRGTGEKDEIIKTLRGFGYMME